MHVVRIRALALALSPFALVAFVGCSSPTEESAESLSLAQESASNCSFVPGCRRLLEADARPFVASLMTFDDPQGRGIREQLLVNYLEPPSRSFLPCSDYREPRTVSFVFVYGPPEARRSLTREASVACANSYGDGQREHHRATLVIDKGEDPEVWDTLFPPARDGSRWYALEIAAVNHRGTWESRFGANYGLVFAPR